MVVCVCAYMRMHMYMHMCIHSCVHIHVCVCVCVMQQFFVQSAIIWCAALGLVKIWALLANSVWLLWVFSWQWMSLILFPVSVWWILDNVSTELAEIWRMYMLFIDTFDLFNMTIKNWNTLVKNNWSSVWNCTVILVTVHSLKSIFVSMWVCMSVGEVKVGYCVHGYMCILIV